MNSVNINFSKQNRNRRGETLVEVLVAFFVIAMTTSATTFYSVQTHKTAQRIEKRFIANELAESAIEWFVGMKKSNALKFQNENCWDADPQENSCGEDFGDKLLSQNDTQPHYFAIVIDPATFEEVLKKISTPLDLQKNDSIGAQNNKEYGLYKTSEKGFLSGFGNIPPADTEEPKYYRMFQIQRTENQKDGIKVTARIQWRSEGEIKNLEIEETFINF